eukprot:GHRR01007224.1.p1 GENE.GHRR01007224.1~~GHRR01007224.1.p1  ORF type:complete len:794 (+),score=327.13 GHRR01007224.1:497-2878(+)
MHALATSCAAPCCMVSIWVFADSSGSVCRSLFYNDVLCFHTTTNRWDKLIPKCPFRARANHTATLIGNSIWFIGGSDADDVLGDVFYLDLTTRTWHKALIEDPHKLLLRCAHAAEVHPRRPSTIILMGGYGHVSTGVPEQQPYNMNNDVLLLHTDGRQVELVTMFSSCPPAPRAYHSMSIIGDRAYIFGGRNIEGVIQDNSLLCVYDTLQNCWLLPSNVSGNAPCPRSSHRAVAFDSRVIMYGGAGEDRGRKERMNDVYSLCLLQGGQQLCWSPCDSPAPCANMPPGRSAHTMSLIGETLYVICGYAGATWKKYARDCWKLKLLCHACTHWQPALARDFTNKEQINGQKPAAPSIAVAQPAAKSAANDLAGWRTAKRQRSGGQGQRQMQQQQQPCNGVAANGWQSQQHQQHQRGQALHQYQSAPPQQQCGVTAQALAAATMAAVNAIAAGSVPACNAFVAVGEQRCSASPPYGGPAELQRQQELEHVRDLLQQQYSKTSCLEGENRQLKRQLLELKNELRSDKQQVEQQLQQLQREAMRHKLAAEQALVRQQREQEEVQLLAQQLDSVKQACRKAQLARDQATGQIQSANAELKKLPVQLAEANRSNQQLQQLLQQQQEKQRQVEEGLAHERQQQQQAITDTRACLEQHKNELRRLNDFVTEERRKHETSLNQCTTELANKELQLQEKACAMLDLQQQLDNSKAAVAEQQKQTDVFKQMHQDVQQQLELLRQSHSVVATDKARLETELGKLREDHEKAKAELDQRMTAMNSARAAMLQMQGLQATVLNALDSR